MTTSSEDDLFLTIGGHDYWLVNSKLRPHIAGAADDGDKPPADPPDGDKPPADKPPGDPPDGDKPPADKPPADPADHAADAEKWKALSRKHEKQAKENADAARKLAELEEADKTESQRLTDKATKAEKDAADAKAELARLRVASAKGLPADLADRLRGDTEDELNEDADRLLKLMKPAPNGSVDGGPQGDDKPPRPASLEDAVTKALGG